MAAMVMRSVSSGVWGTGNETYVPRPPAVGRPYALTAKCPSGRSRMLSVLSMNSSPRRVSVQRSASGTVTLMARALTSGASSMLMAARLSRRHAPRFHRARRPSEIRHDDRVVAASGYGGLVVVGDGDHPEFGAHPQCVESAGDAG